MATKQQQIQLLVATVVSYAPHLEQVAFHQKCFSISRPKPLDAGSHSLGIGERLRGPNTTHCCCVCFAGVCGRRCCSAFFVGVAAVAGTVLSACAVSGAVDWVCCKSSGCHATNVAVPAAVLVVCPGGCFCYCSHLLSSVDLCLFVCWLVLVHVTFPWQ